MRVSIRRAHRLVRCGLVMAAVAAVAALGACGGSGKGTLVGNGVGPSQLLISPSTNLAETTGERAYPCELVKLTARMVFSDGSVGNFTARVNWSSSSPDVVDVSNGNLLVEGGGGATYARGTLLPHTTGSAYITADFQGMKASFRIDVGSAPQNLRFYAARENSYVPVSTLRNYDTSAGVLWLASSTNQALKVIGDVDGVPTDLTDSVRAWAFDQGGDPGVAVAAAGNPAVVSAIGPGAQQSLRISFWSCTQTAPLQIAVADPIGLTIEPEFSNSPHAGASEPQYPASYAGPDLLMLGNSEVLRVRADLGQTYVDGNGTTRYLEPDVSPFAPITSSDTSVLTIGGTGLINLAGGVSAGLATVTAQGVNFPGFNSSNPLMSAPLQLQVADATLEQIFVSPLQDPSPQSPPFPLDYTQSTIAGSFDFTQFNAIGIFSANDGSGATYYQPVTRTVTWSVDQPTLASISSDPSTAGQAITSGTPATVKILAHSPTATVAPDASGHLVIQAPVNTP
jgi:hypothetical protein